MLSLLLDYANFVGLEVDEVGFLLDCYFNLIGFRPIDVQLHEEPLCLPGLLLQYWLQLLHLLFELAHDLVGAVQFVQSFTEFGLQRIDLLQLQLQD